MIFSQCVAGFFTHFLQMIRVDFNVVELTATLHYNFALLIHVFIFSYIERSTHT